MNWTFALMQTNEINEPYFSFHNFIFRLETFKGSLHSSTIICLHKI